MAFFITRALILAVGYLYPAYECYKIVEKARPEAKELLFWCQYWIIIAAVTVLERLGDTFVSWVPMYNEAKFAFIIYLWHPHTRGTTYVYSTFVRPLLSKHEPVIDQHLNEWKTRAFDIAFHYWQRGSVYAQSRFVEVLQYVASQSPPESHVQPQPTPSPANQQQQPAPAAAHQQQQQPTEQQTGQPQANVEYVPSAPILPPAYETSTQQQSHEVIEDVMEMTNAAQASPPVDEPPVPDVPVQRSRSRSRSRRYQP